jgi:pyruvate/2-oxoglutarate dehydrogenase complex dihydrolipoamide acyltransferase (E2) component
MQIVRFSPNREFLADQLMRAKRFHCSVNLVYEFDLTDTLVALDEARRAGREVGLMALLVKATALLMEKHPRLNRHVFHRMFHRAEVAFEHISCTLIVGRQGPAGEELLFPVLIRDTHRLTIAEIHRVILLHKHQELSDLPQMAGFRRIQRMSWLARKYFSYKARSDPRFYERYFGTYGLSSNLRHGWGPIGGAAVANTAVAFVPGALRDLPGVIAGEIRVRRVLSMGLILDHYLLDGAEVARAMDDLRPMLESPALLRDGSGVP